MGKNKKKFIKNKKSQIHLLMIGGVLLVAVIVLFATINITKNSKENIKDTEEGAKKSSSIIVSPNIVKLNPITCNNNQSATIDLAWTPISMAGEYYVVVETFDKKPLDVIVESTGTDKLNAEKLQDKITFNIPENKCNETFYVKIEVTKDNQKEQSLQKQVYFNITHQTPQENIEEEENEEEEEEENEEEEEEVCSIIPENGQIYYLEQLNYIDTNTETLSGSYTLMRDLNFLDDSSYCQPENYKTTWTTRNGWNPIGSSSNPFTGQFNGNLHKITNLFIKKQNYNFIGFFGNINTAYIQNISLEDSVIFGNKFVGVLAGTAFNSTIINSHTSGQINNTTLAAGGLLGTVSLGHIQKCSSNTDISLTTDGNIAGGLIGTIINSCAISNSYATGSISGNYYLGGFVGNRINVETAELLNVLLSADVSSNEDNSENTISNSYATGSISGNNYIGGFIGFDNINLTIINSFWNMTTSNQNTSAGDAVGLTDPQMKSSESFVSWDFDNVWAIDEGNSYPYLRDNPQDPLPGSIE